MRDRGTDISNEFACMWLLIDLHKLDEEYFHK